MRNPTRGRVLHRIGLISARQLEKEPRMFTMSWLKDAAERALKTFAQSLLGVLTLGGADVLHLDWGDTLSIAGTATVISVLTSIVSAGVANPGTASLTKAVESSEPTGRHHADDDPLLP